MNASKFLAGTVFLLFTLLASELRGATSVGCAAVWSGEQPISIEVPIELNDEKVLENDHVAFPKAPPDLKSQGGSGPWCFSLNDERFAYVHTFYYVTQQARWFKKLASALGIAPLGQIAIDLVKVDREMPAGASMHGNIMLRFPVPALDPTVIAHEVGHEIHYHVAGLFVDRLVEGSMKESNWRQAAEQLGVIEGTANLLSALFTGQTRVGGFSYRDAPFDIDSFVRFPDVVPSLDLQLRRFIGAPGFRAEYPNSVRTLEETLKAPSSPLKEMLSQPDAYLTSAVINQPMWRAAVRFGFERIELLYLAALREVVDFRSYSDLARRIERIAEKDLPVQAFLKSEFRRRGI